MDQFTYAERATDWRGNNNIAESIFSQMAYEPHAVPRWIVVGAGTGGTSATIGRFIRYQRHPTRLCVADPENSVFYDYFHSGDSALVSSVSSRIEGIGRPRVEPSFVASIVDDMLQVPDAASIATARFLERLLGRKCGASTGTNVYACFQLMAEMQLRGESGSVVSLLCDSGDRYLPTYYNDDWVAAQKLDLKPYLERLESFYETGLWSF